MTEKKTRHAPVEVRAKQREKGSKTIELFDAQRIEIKMGSAKWIIEINDQPDSWSRPQRRLMIRGVNGGCVALVMSTPFSAYLYDERSR